METAPPITAGTVQREGPGWPPPHSLHLAEHGIRVFVCRYFNHDYLWFSGTEFSKRSETLPILHNYALTYSLGDFSYWIGPATPRYEEDLAMISLYATPASTAHVSRTRLTCNALDDLTLRTDTGKRGVNTPDLGYRTYLDPVFDEGADRSEPRGFLGYVFAFNDRVPKGVTRLGKKGASWRIRSVEIAAPRAEWTDQVFVPSHPVNPLDLSGRVDAYEPVALPPHFLMQRAHLREDWVVRRVVDGVAHVIHVPHRVLQRCTASQ